MLGEGGIMEKVGLDGWLTCISLFSLEETFEVHSVEEIDHGLGILRKLVVEVNSHSIAWFCCNLA
jgi:hypothetical protein